MSTDLGLDSKVNAVTKENLTGYRTAVEDLVESGGRSDRNPFGGLGLLDAALGVSVGQIYAYAGETAPENHLICNGALVSRQTYAALFLSIGTLYGAGNGSTTFALPDLRGAGIVGAGGTRIAGPNILPGQSWDKDEVELELANLPRHRHSSGTLQTNIAGAHTHSYRYGSGGSQGAGGIEGGNATTGAGGGHSHTLSGTLLNAGDGDDMSVLQPSMDLIWIIRSS